MSQVPFSSRWVERAGLALVVVILLGLWLASRERESASEDKHTARALLDRVEMLAAENGALADRIEKVALGQRQTFTERLAGCERFQKLVNVEHQFLQTVADERRRSGKPEDIATAKEYEALDALIWPQSPCSVLVAQPPISLEGGR